MEEVKGDMSEDIELTKHLEDREQLSTLLLSLDILMDIRKKLEYAIKLNTEAVLATDTFLQFQERQRVTLTQIYLVTKQIDEVIDIFKMSTVSITLPRPLNEVVFKPVTTADFTISDPVGFSFDEL
jgi:hypothetical protein